MIHNTLIALAAVSAAALVLAPAANAKTHIKFNVAVNLGGAGIYVGPGYYDDAFVMVSDEPDCGWEMVKHKKWNANHTHKVVFFTKQYVCG